MGLRVRVHQRVSGQLGDPIEALAGQLDELKGQVPNLEEPGTNRAGGEPLSVDQELRWEGCQHS